MIEFIKKYWQAALAIAGAILFAIINKRGQKIDALEAEIGRQKAGAELENQTKEADQASQTYLDSKRDFERYKLEHPELFKRK